MTRKRRRQATEWAADYPQYTDAELREFIRRWQQDRDEESRNQVVLGLTPLVICYADDFDWHGIDHGDLVGDGVLFLLEKIIKFDLARDSKVATWVRRCLRSFWNTRVKSERSVIHIPTYWGQGLGANASDRAIAARSRVESGIKSLHSVGYRNIPTIDGGQQSVDDADDVAWAERQVASLPERYQEVVHRRCAGETIPQIAKSIGISSDAVTGIYHRAIAIIRERVQ